MEIIWRIIYFWKTLKYNRIISRLISLSERIFICLGREKERKCQASFGFYLCNNCGDSLSRGKQDEDSAKDGGEESPVNSLGRDDGSEADGFLNNCVLKIDDACLLSP